MDMDFFLLMEVEDMFKTLGGFNLQAYNILNEKIK
jgi:hypothetical protein